MTSCISYEGQQASLLIKALDYFHETLRQRPLTPRDEAYRIATANGLFFEPKDHSRYVGRLKSDVRRRNSDFGAINLYFVEGTDELSTKDVVELANYAAAVHVFLRDAALQVNSFVATGGTLDALSRLYVDLIQQFNDQVERRRDERVVDFLTDEKFEADCDTPTTYLYRFRTALAQLCNDHVPDEILCQKWLDEGDDAAHAKLQDWAASHAALPWTMGISVIESAMQLAGDPMEGVDHQSYEEAVAEVKSRLNRS